MELTSSNSNFNSTSLALTNVNVTHVKYLVDSVHPPPFFVITMDINDIRRIIQDQNLIDRGAIASQISTTIARIVSSKTNAETNKIDFTDAATVTSVLCEAISQTVITTTEQTVPSAVSACVTAIKDLVKEDIKKEIVPEVICETRDYVDSSVGTVGQWRFFSTVRYIGIFYYKHADMMINVDIKRHNLSFSTL